MGADQTFSWIPSLQPPISVPLTVVPEHECAYLPKRMARTRAFSCRDMPAELYHDFMDAGFRRSGDVFYQPICRGCRACRAIRLLVSGFSQNKSQRRCRKRNSDLKITIGPPRASDEKFDLYRRYQAQRHGKLDEERDGFEAFLYKSPVQTVEIEHRDGCGKLMGIGICDISSRSLSSVYFYFDPQERKRGLGVYGALVEIDIARAMGIPYYYLGFWVEGCDTMQYKANFRPCEMLGTDGVWRRYR